MLGTIDAPPRAREWLGRLVGEVNAGSDSPDRQAVNVALTSAGLGALGLPPQIGAQFRPSHRRDDRGAPAAHPRRRRRQRPGALGLGRPEEHEIHVLLMVFARHEQALADALRRHEEAMPEAGIRLLRTLDTAPLEDREHFGFLDGISQPALAGLGGADALHTIQDGEVVLGYRNEYRRFTPRPLVPADDDPAGVLPSDAEGSGHRDLGRNGSYLVMRQFSQDVYGFWDFCERATARPDGSVDERARLRLAAKLLGRWPSGAPLVLAPDDDRPEPPAPTTTTSTSTPDRAGLRCRLGAHIQRANPRDTLDPSPGTDRSIAVNKRHGLLRRGRKYGTLLTRDDLLTAGTDVALARRRTRRLRFVCLVANMSRQFEFVQHSWLNEPALKRPLRPPRPAARARAAGQARLHRAPSSPYVCRYTGLPSFVTVRGGAYFSFPDCAPCAPRRAAGVSRGGRSGL